MPEHGGNLQRVSFRGQAPDDSARFMRRLKSQFPSACHSSAFAERGCGDESQTGAAAAQFQGYNH
jgi:hypothetical protein